MRAVALDKTGTLTLGLPQLQRSSRPTDGEDEALALVAAVERRLRAPARRRAAPRGARARLGGLPSRRASRRCPGRGATATVDGRELWAGGPRLMQERLGALPAGVRALHEAGQTAIALGEGDRAARAVRPRRPAAGGGRGPRRATPRAPASGAS